MVKSGTKRFHASAWEFRRNDALDARNYFSRRQPRFQNLRFNVFGFNVGGQVPVWKEHPTFFFYNMEWRRIVQGGSVNQQVPVTDTYGGDFAGNVPADFLDVNKTPIPNSGLHVPCANQLSPTQVAAFTNAGITNFSTPAADGSCTVNTGKTAAQNPIFNAFPLNLLGSSSVSLVTPNATALLNAGIFPGNNSVNSSGNPAFLGGNDSPTYVREEIARVDHEFTKKFSVFGHSV